MNSPTSATPSALTPLNASDSSNATDADVNANATATATPTPTPTGGGTSALGDDASTPSTSSTAALSTLTTCMQSIVVGDVAYAQCVMNSGLFALNETQPANLRRQLRNTSSTEGALLAYLRTQLSSEQLRTSSIGMCRLQCTAPSFHASSSCCDATAQLRACQLTEATQTPTLVTCKQALDASLAFSNQECRALSQQDTALVGVASGGVVAAILALCVGLYFQRSKRRKRAAQDPKQDPKQEQDGELLAWFRQVAILVWKNVVLRARKPVALVVEQLVPLLFVSALVVLANLDTLFGRNSNALYRTSTQAAASSTLADNPLLCVSLAPLSATDLGAPNATLRSFYSSGQSVLGLFFLLSFIKFVSSTTAAMVHEKEIKMREMMKIMGVSTSALLVSWSATATLLALPVVCVLSALLKFGNVFPTTPFAVVLLLFWSLSVATVAFAYALTPFFRKSRTAAICSVLVWLLLFFPFFVVQPKTTSGAKYAAALLAPPTAFALAIDRLLREAQLGTGFAYSMTAAVQQTAFDGVPTASALSGVLLLDALWLLVVGWYFEQVLPQQFGVRKHWLFVLQRDYWRSHSAKLTLKPAATATAPVATQHAVQSPSLYALASPSGPDSHHYAASLTPLETPTVLHISELTTTSNSTTTAVVEPVSAELLQQERTGASLQLHSLTKIFTLQDGEQKRAVDSLSLTFYAGQITSLLGHNGAGKTTTISLLTGLLPPTAGDALLFGRSLQRESDAFRRIMGVCPQHDVLFPELSVYEHLRFFAVLKRIQCESSSWIQELLDDVGLSGSQHVLSKNLSGGQKRKLSVALALLGDSKLVFFDEPTSGMDPYSRRFTWELLRRKREGRVIVLTTHFMDEADVLGDRIAILADGKLRCVGSSLFLKTRYGAGYNLTMIKTPACQISVVQHFLESYLGARGATLASESGSEVVFTLPTNAAPRFPVLFDALDAAMHSTLGIRNYGISVTTLEDVFLRIAHERDDDHDHNDDHNHNAEPQPQPQPLQLQPQPQPQPQLVPPTFASQFRTLLLKRWWISKRDKKALVNAIGIPLLFLLLVAALPEIQVASFLPDYATSFASPAQQQTCPALSITANRLDPNTYTRCMVQGYGFCSLGIIDCDARACCDAANVISPFYPCSTCPVSSSNQQLQANSSSTAQPCYSGKCMRRNGAKLQIALNAFVTAMVVMLAFAFVPAATIAFVVKEREPHQDARALQWISGMSLRAYWASNFVHDLAVISVPVVAALVATPLANRALRSEGEELLAMALLVVAHALCIVPVSYLYARRFQQHASAQTSMLVFALSSGGLLSIFSFLCRVVDFSMSRSLTLSGLDRDYLRWVFLLFPGYALHNGIFELATRKITRGSLFGYWSRNANPQASLFGLFRGFGKNPRCVACWNRNLPGCCVRGALDFDVALAPILYMVVEAVVLTVLLFALETRTRRRTQTQNETQTQSNTVKTNQKVATDENIVAVEGDDDEDDDVVAERIRLDQQLLPVVVSSHGDQEDQDQENQDDDNDNGNAIVIRHLHHKYSDDRVALHDLSLAIPRGQCFGYLGVNGAGKSTTIKVLTQQVVSTSGSVSVAGRDILSSRTDSRQRQQPSLIGYCPQFDALHDLLTVEQELMLYARLKGISPPEMVVRDAIERLGLDEYAHKLTRGLSGGNKRKVSTAIALLGAPRIVVLDEPSTGMDPSARRKMWTVISDTCTQNQTSVLLTTHSMEECEALCSRVGILVKGKLTCLGSVQHLRDKFGRGFTVDVTLQREPSGDHVAAMERRVREELQSEGGDEELLHVLSERQVEQVCAALGDVQRGVELTASSEWWSAPAAAAVDGSSSSSGSAMDGRVMVLSTFCAWWLAQLRSEALVRFLPQRFPGTTLVEKHGDHVRFHIPKQHGDEHHHQKQLRPKEIFEVLERGKSELFIQEYSVSDTSLEHIFNRMADDGDKSNRNESDHHADTSESD